MPRAKAEFQDQLLYLQSRSPQGADTWATEFHSVISDLEDSPERHGLAPENSDHDRELRQVIFRTKKGNPYRLIFTVNEEKVFVLSMRGVGQDYVEL